jgi:uncharacterized membrane protein YcaP (DUF421 family)
VNQYLDIIFRCVSVYLLMIIALQIFGKKELSQLNTPDIILILLISNAVQNAMVGTNSSLTGGLLAAIVLFILNFIIKKLMFKYQKISNLLQGKPEILIHNGQLDFKILSKLNLTNQELEQAVREHGVENFKDVKLAILEIDGSISIISGEKNLTQTHYKRSHNHKNLNGSN